MEDIRVTRDLIVLKYSDNQPEEALPTSAGRNVLEKAIPSITTFVQFMSISFHNVTLVLKTSNSRLWHAMVNRLQLDGSILPNSNIAICMLVDTVTARALQSDTTSIRDYPPNVEGHGSWQACAAEFLLSSTQLEVHITATEKPVVQRLLLAVNHPHANFSDNFVAAILEGRARTTDTKGSGSQPLQWISLWPQNLDVTVVDTSVKITKGHLVDYLKANVSSLQLILKTQSHNLHSAIQSKMLPEASASLRVQETYAETKHARWFSLTQATLDAQASENTIISTTEISRMSFYYVHNDVQPWLALTKFSGSSGANTQKVRRETSPWNFKWKFNLTTTDMSAIACFPGTLPLRSGVSYVQVKCEGNAGNEVLGGELQADTFWCFLGNRSPSDPSQKKLHFWNTPWHVGLLIARIDRRRQNNTISMNSQVLLDVVRLEWNPLLAQAVLSSVTALESMIRVRSPKFPQPEREPVIHSVAVTAAGINIFMLMKKEIGFMVRLDSFAFDKQPEKFVLSVEGVKGINIAQGTPFPCMKAAEIKNELLHLHRLQLIWRASSRHGHVEINEVLALKWQTWLHMCALELSEELRTFQTQLKVKIPAKEPAPSDCPPEEGVPGKPSNWNFHLKGTFSLNAVLSSKHNVELRTTATTAAWHGSDWSLKMPEGELLFDSLPIVQAEGVHWMLRQSDPEIKEERNNFDFLSQTDNRCGILVMSQLNFCFPYQYGFAEACQQDLLAIYKWLKLLHKKPVSGGKKPDGPLYRDIRIAVENFSLQLCDDPFEVKLRDNYELWEDEYRESHKRKRMLDAKIEELKKTHPLLPQGKIEELYGNLARKNAEIFVQRAQRMYDTTPMRTSLFRWQMEKVDIIALADPALHGYKNITRHIQDMDPESPWPEEEIQFTTLWCRAVRATCRQWRFLLRDFPQPLLDIRELLLWGRLAGAEQEAPWRAKRTCTVQVAQPYNDVTIERGMIPLKFYHDFSCDTEAFSLAYGPCWEPVIAQCNLAWDYVSPPSRDPSPPLPIWDKIRLLFHGRLTISFQQLTLLLHTSLDPYNTTEEMEVSWTDLAMDWTNAKFVLKGDLNVHVRTASKYDDCRLLHVPNLKMTIRLTWHSLGDPNDHHCVVQCAPDRLPEYSSNQEHDSYRAFRSQNLTLALSMETKMGANQVPEVKVLLYGSTLRWFENLKFILSGVSRPTRRGVLFKNTKPRKIQFSRHYKAIRLALSLHRFHICYWMSFSMQRGFELNCGRLTLSSEHNLRLVPIEDGLKHRPRADWSVVFLNCELQEAEVWLQSALGPESEEKDELNISMHQPVEKFYFLSVLRVSYGREAVLNPFIVRGSSAAPGSGGLPTHHLVVQDLRAAWTKNNRDVAFALYDSFVKAQLLKKNLSPEVLRLLRLPESGASPIKPRSARPTGGASGGGGGDSNQTTPPRGAASTPISDSMLQQLLADVNHRNVVFSEDLTSTGRAAATVSSTTTDSEGVHLNWLIELVNSQVLLKGCETKGYVIISAARAKILQRQHSPVWKDRALVSKTSWICSLEGMQYFATVSAGDRDTLDENIQWITTGHIGGKEGPVVDLPDMVGSGQSVGGVVSETVGGATDPNNSTVQLQRIVSRCSCEMCFVSYGQNTLDLDDAIMNEMDIPPPPSGDVMDLWAQREQPVDSFVLTHHDLNICTNSLQWAMLLDVVNNLLLYVEPHRKEASEKLQRLRFQLQLSSLEDQRRPLQQLQNQLRSLVCQLRRLERETYLVQRALTDEPHSEPLMRELETLERRVYECKEQINGANEELAMVVSCLKEAQLSANQRLQAARQGNADVTPLRNSEICFKHAQWRLTEADGQLGIADVVLSNFKYHKRSNSDNSAAHTMEIGYVSVTNLLPNQIYRQVLLPTEIKSNMPVDRQIALRVYSTDKAPVGGICIKEHFEVNVVPFTIAITYQFFKSMMKFCFPEKDPEALDGESEDSSGTLQKKGSKNLGSSFGSSSTLTKKTRESSFYVPIEDKDDVEKMKERAEQNKLFIYIKIPEVPVKVSYKGEKEKNIEDVNEFSLVIPTLEYHNVTWTWLDLFLAMKNDSKRVLLSQAIKQKLQIRPRVIADLADASTPHEEDKARMLLGDYSLPGEARSSKRGFFKGSKHDGKK